MNDLEAKAKKAVELFGARWGNHTQTSFIRHAPTEDEISSIPAGIYHWHNAPHIREVAIDRFRAHVQMESYPDYRLGFISTKFESDVCEVLNAKAMTSKETKSKVMSLGNRLSSRMDRHEAFVRAWAIVKAGGLELAVKGTSFGNRQEALRRLSRYAPEQIRAFIVPEPANPADPAAVAVMVGVQNGRGLYCMGYLPREYAPAAASLKAKGLRVLGWGNKGVRLALAV